MPPSRIELKDRLLMELGFVLEAPRRLLYDASGSPPSEAKLALAQTQFRRELDEWVSSSFRPFITIHGSEITHFWNIVMGPCFSIGNILVKSATIDEKRKEFEAVITQTLAAIRSIPADDPDVMTPPKSAFVAYRRLHAIVVTASTRIHLFDPYLDVKSFLLYFADVPDSVEIKVVADRTLMAPPLSERRKVFQRDRIVAASEMLASDRPGNYSFLMPPSIHDRHLRVDNTIFHLGGSVAHAAMKDYYSIIETDSNPGLHATLDAIIGSAVPWYAPGISKHRRWCSTCAAVRDVKSSGACQSCNTPL